MINFLFLLFFSVNISSAEDRDSCLFFKYCGGASDRPSRSLPSSSSAVNLNPSSVSNVKGVGIEALYQNKNPIALNVVSGNGKIGAIVSPTLENSFFGNRSIEIDDLHRIRQINKQQYKNTKLNLAVGAKLFNKKYFGLDLGFSAKRNPDIKNINPGAGLTARLAFLHVGAYFYQDDVKIDLGNYASPYTYIPYSVFYGRTTYQEKFSVSTYTFGTEIRNLSLDAGIIKTRYKFYDENTRVYLYSSAYSYKKFLFNFAIRKEYSPNMAYRNGVLTLERKKTDFYYGTQYFANQFFLLGLQYNNFLLKEWSATLTIYF